jgi:hypothetical protein
MGADVGTGAGAGAGSGVAAAEVPSTTTKDGSEDMADGIVEGEGMCVG